MKAQKKISGEKGGFSENYRKTRKINKEFRQKYLTNPTGGVIYLDEVSIYTHNAQQLLMVPAGRAINYKGGLYGLRKILSPTLA